MDVNGSKYRFCISTLPVQILHHIDGDGFSFNSYFDFNKYYFNFLFTPLGTKENFTVEKKKRFQIWKNKFFISMVPLVY